MSEENNGLVIEDVSNINDSIHNVIIDNHESIQEETINDDNSTQEDVHECKQCLELEFKYMRERLESLSRDKESSRLNVLNLFNIAYQNDQTDLFYQTLMMKIKHNNLKSKSLEFQDRFFQELKEFQKNIYFDFVYSLNKEELVELSKVMKEF